MSKTMSELLNNLLNLEILECICNGDAVEINLNDLARSLGKHRNTVRTRVNELLENRIIKEPWYPFLWMYREYPLLVIARADLDRNGGTDRFLVDDEHIMSAYYVRDEEYKTLLIELHKDIHSYGVWRSSLVTEKKIPPRETRAPADAIFFDMRHVIKYQPNAAIKVLELKHQDGEQVRINGCSMNNVCFQILKKLVQGEGIRTNENLLSKKLNVHRKTIERRVDALLRENVVGPPICRFPNLFVAPGQILVYHLVEIRKMNKNIIQTIRADPHIPLAVEASYKRYNLLMFGVFSSVEEHFMWVEQYDTRFPNTLGAMKKIYLSPKMSTEIDQKKIPMGIIKGRKELLYGRKLMDSVAP